jgi:hypothetical protein
VEHSSDPEIFGKVSSAEAEANGLRELTPCVFW